MKLFRDKKGMEIAVSTVVGMVLGALMLFAGIALLANVMLKVDSSHDQLNEQMEQEIIMAFDNNDPVYIHKNPLTPGNKDKDVVFGIGIHNIYNTNRDFNISVEPSSELKQIFNDKNLQLGYFDEPFEIGSRQKEVVFVIVPVNVLPEGQHALTLKVEHNNGTHWLPHGTPRILYVNK